jgi:hypothetical protein
MLARSVRLPWPSHSRAKIEAASNFNGPYSMEQMYDDLDVYKYQLKCAERKYQTYVMKAAWSDEDCYRVDELNAIIEKCIAEIDAINYLLEPTNKDNS